jgi:hypothetical protein
MKRIQRVLVGLLVAYAASMTLLASRRSAEALLFRRLHELATRGHVQERPSGFPLREFARDFGLNLSRLEIWSLLIGDIQGPLLVPAIVVFFLLGLGAALFRIPPPSRFDKD